MEVKWLKTALNNLEREVDYIAKENPEAAKKVVQRIHNSVSLLENNSSIGRAGRVNGTRSLLSTILHT